MSFRKTKNRHDQWNSCVIKHKNEIISVGLPEELFLNEKLLDHFLTIGKIELKDNGVIFISLFSDKQFLVLEKFVIDWYEDMVGGQDYLEDFCKERVKRFGRYG